MASERQLAAILFTDMVGSTQLAQENEPAALVLLEEQTQLARPIVDAHHGRLVKSTGDGLLVEFPSALDAVEAAVAFQRRADERNTRPGAVPLRVRIGIHLGDVQRRDGDIFGDAVNVAARVESAAEPGGIFISEAVYVQVRNKVSYRLESAGAQSLKGLREPIELFRVVVPGPAEPGPSARVQPPRLAVLPLANISPDPKDEYFADGLTEELIAVLSKVPGVRVIARTSVNPYKASGKSVAQIGKDLSVSAILEGSVRKAGERLRITLQLIDVASQEHIWSERYDRELADVFAIQTEVAESTAKAVRVELSEHARARLQRPPTTDLGAYELYLRAVLQEYELSNETFQDSIRLLEEAVRRDPDFALAYAHLGHRYVQGAGDYLPHREGFAKARTCVARAMELDPNLSEAHSALANLSMQDDHDWTRAEAEFVQALELNPSNLDARVSYSTLLRVLGRVSESEQQLRWAVEVDPKSWLPRWLLVDLALDGGEIDLARNRLQQLPSLGPSPSLTHLSFALYYAERGEADAARRELEMAGISREPLFRIGRAIVLGLMGDPKEARALSGEFASGPTSSFVSKDFIAMLLAVAGDREGALSLIGTLVTQRESGLWLRHRSPAFDSIREDPRFVAALRSFGLPDSAFRAAPRTSTAPVKSEAGLRPRSVPPIKVTPIGRSTGFHACPMAGQNTSPSAGSVPGRMLP